MNNLELTEQKAPQLDKPGAGLPFLEWLVAKYILVPRLLKAGSKESALAFFSKESEKIIDLVSGLTLDQIIERKLIERLRGMEDSSRFWSVAMTLQHLTIVADGIKSTVAELSKGNIRLPKAETKNVKPSPEVDGKTILDAFQQMCKSFVIEANSVNVNAFPKATFDHPWFGPLNAKDWLVIAAAHQRIHRQQIEKIIALTVKI